MSVDGDWLRTLHSSYVERYAADLDRTWSTATWLVALAWTLIPAAVTISDPLTWQTVGVFAVTSMALIVLWAAIADIHQKWSARCYDVVRAIEIVALDETSDQNIHITTEDAHMIRGLGRAPMKSIRRWIIFGTAIAWLVLIGYAIFLEVVGKQSERTMVPVAPHTPRTREILLFVIRSMCQSYRVLAPGSSSRGGRQ